MMIRCMAFVWLLLLAVAQAGAMDVYVSPNGRPAADGSQIRPFSTLEQARDHIRAVKEKTGMPTKGIRVLIGGGKYFIEQSFTLGKSDSGEPGQPIVYMALGNKKPRFIGGMELDRSNTRPVIKSDPAYDQLPEAAQGYCVAINLTRQGVRDYGKMRVRGFGKSGVAHMELFFNGKAMQLARWPNEGMETIAALPDGNKSRNAKHQGNDFLYESDRPARWSAASDPWIYGFFYNGWADLYAPISGIDKEKKRIEIGSKPNYGIGVGGRWYALNLLEELDQPGEYYVDRKTKTLYFWPPALLGTSEVMLSTLGEDGRAMLDVRDVHDVRIEGLSFEVSRASGVKVQNSRDVKIISCVVRNLGGSGISVTGGTDCVIEDCEISDVESGISVNAGDRATLTPAGHEVRNNHIHHFSRWCRTYHGGLHLGGVGNIAANNLIHDAPHTAIFVGGNNHVVEYNEIHHVVQRTDDSGALYEGRDWGSYGNIIRYNFFHHIESAYKGREMHGVHAIYLDDCDSGDTVIGNVFYRVSGRAMMSGGGRDNLFENNVIVDCGSAFFTDKRGNAKVNDTPGDSWNLVSKIKKYNYTQPPWSTAYPSLAAILDNGLDRAKLPEGNVVRRNIGWRNKRWMEENGWGGAGAAKLYKFEDNVENGDPMFVNEETLDMRLKPDSPALKIPGFKAIPFEKIGRK